MKLAKFSIAEDFLDYGEPVLAVWNGVECFHLPKNDWHIAVKLCKLLNKLIDLGEYDV